MLAPSSSLPSSVFAGADGGHEARLPLEALGSGRRATRHRPRIRAAGGASRGGILVVRSHDNTTASPFPFVRRGVPDFRSANFRATVADHLRDRLFPATIRRDDSTGELTSWPSDDRPEPRSPPPEAPDGARVSSPIDLCGSPEGSNRAVSETPSPTPLRARLGEAARTCLLYTSPSPRDLSTSRMPSSA